MLAFVPSVRLIQGMTYQDILQQQLKRRIDMNPRYSLRAFAGFLDLQASKLSEILGNKKGLSLEKAQQISRKLKLDSFHHEIFTLSVEAQHSRFQTRKTEAARQLEKLLSRNKGLSEKTLQKCAWYYGAVEAYLEQGQQDFQEISQKLGITVLQVENAKRFIIRRAKNWPERKHIRIEESSLLQKTQAAYIQGAGHFEADAFFLALTSQEKQELQSKIQDLVMEFKKRKKSADSSIQMIGLQFISL